MNERFEDFAAAMRGIDTPQSARNATRKAVADARVNGTKGTVPLVPHPIGWYVAAGCAVAAVALVALGISGIVTSTGTQEGNSATTVPAAPNSFTLAAYAGEVPLAGTEEMAMESGDWSAILGYTEVPIDGDTVTCDLGLNLTCTGSNIKTLTYQIEGSGFAFALHKEVPDPETTYRTKVTVSTTWKTTPQELEDYPETGTLPYVRVKLDKTEEIERATDRCEELREQYPFKGQGDASWNAIPDDVKQAIRDASTDLGVAVRTAAANRLPEATLSVTATFTDGSEQTHSYRLSPVKDFEERYRANDWGEGTSSLITVEQLS